MSNAARKARKRQAYDFTHNPDGSRRPVRSRAQKLLTNTFWYDRRHKVGTPVLERLENQPRQVYGKGLDSAPTRFGITSRTAHRLISRGVTAEEVGL